MDAMLQMGYGSFAPVYRRAGSSVEKMDQYLSSLAELEQRLPPANRAIEYRRLLDQLERGDVQAWLELENARAARFAPTEARLDPQVIERYDSLDIASLRQAARTDREAAAALLKRYEKMSDFEIFRMYTEEADETAAAIIRQRYPSNEAALRRILGSDYRPPHHATAVLRRGGMEVRREQLVSGGMTAAERALGFPKNILATHTEARAVTRLELHSGDFLEIRGQYDPCGSCVRAMQGSATRSGATIRYWWPSASRVFLP
jgi:hypothetical protein